MLELTKGQDAKGHNSQNIINFSVEILHQICSEMSVTSFHIVINILKFLLEVIDGPCIEN